MLDKDIYRRAMRQARRIKKSGNKRRSIKTLLKTLKEMCTSVGEKRAV